MLLSSSKSTLWLAVAYHIPPHIFVISNFLEAFVGITLGFLLKLSSYSLSVKLNKHVGSLFISMDY